MYFCMFKSPSKVISLPNSRYTSVNLPLSGCPPFTSFVALRPTPIIIESCFMSAGWPSIGDGGERWEGGAKKRGRGATGVHGEAFAEQETLHTRQLQATLVRLDEALPRLLRRRWRGTYPSFFFPLFFSFLQFRDRHVLSSPFLPCIFFHYRPINGCSLLPPEKTKKKKKRKRRTKTLCSINDPKRGFSL